MRERHLKIFVIFVALSGLLLHYQNCGSKSAEMSDAGSNPLLNSDPQVGIINPIETGGIQFLQSKTEITDSTMQIIAYGVCSTDQQGALLSWTLVDTEAQAISKGRSLCDRGTFEVVYEEASSLDCNSTLKLTAYLGSKEKTDLLVEKVCL